MGSSNVKDEHIDIYMEVNKPFYMAGQYVQGRVYVNAKQTRQYINLVVRLMGQEYVYWSQGSGQHQAIYQNKIQNYDSLFTVYDFGGTVKQGQYTFPFSFLLPNTMSGSFNWSDDCYIRYTLRAVMNHPLKQDENQIYQTYLNIMQPPRMPLEPVTAQNTTNSKCCGCCKDYGKTTVSFKCDKNFASNGDSINIEGFIDNSGSTTDIESGKVIFEERRIEISSDRDIESSIDRQVSLGTIRKVNSGQKEHFHVSAQIPANLTSYTAIGACTARYFLISVKTEMGCCADEPFAESHIIIHSKNPSVMKQQKMQPPNGWYPQEYPIVVCNNMRPFLYKPLLGIAFKNSGQGINMMQNKNGGMEPYFGENQDRQNQPYETQNQFRNKL